MSKLIKYEFKKTLFSKLIVLGITGVMELVFLIGILANYENLTAIGMIGLFFAAMAGITYIGLESILLLYRDLTTKQSYMLFMTPNSTYRILGAKVIENGISIFLGGAFFGALAALDFTVLLREHVSLADILDMINEMLSSLDPRLTFNAKILFTFLFMLLCSWLLHICTGYLAVSIGCSLLSGKKGAGFICFIFYIVISILTGLVTNHLPEMTVISRLLLQSVVSLAFSVLMYVISAWIMDRKLSV